MKKNVRPTRWHKLDNTANLFPVIASRNFTNVFRLTAVLAAPVDAAVLQQAVETTLPYFPAFHVRLRHGLFWNYFETNHATPHVQPEEDTPCRYLNVLETDRFLFRVLYYENRIHLETFHALTDGTGALRFLKTICYCYLQLKNPQAYTAEQHATLYGIEHADNVEDGYLKNYIPAQGKGYKEPNAYHLHGERRLFGDMGVVTAQFSVAELKRVCKAENVTISAYLTAAIAYAIYEEFQKSTGSKRPVNVFVPVNLRGMFPSETSLNFFSSITASLPLHMPGISFDEILQHVKQQFSEKITKEAMQEKMASTVRSATNLFVRVVPLPVKSGIIRLVYEGSNNGSTLPFTNIGSVVVDPLFEKDFLGFRVLLSGTPKEPIKVGACSYGDAMALTFTSLLEKNPLAMNVVRRLTSEGIAVTIESNGGEHETL